VLRELLVLGGQSRIELDAGAMCRRDRHDDRLAGNLAAIRVDGHGAVGAPFDVPHDRVQHDARTQFVGHPHRDLLGSAGEAILLRPALDVEHLAEPTCGLDIAHRVQHRHLLGFTTPRDPGHDGHQIPRRRARVHVAQPLVEGLAVEDVGDR
jgi:hypothetical protein